MSGHRVWVLGGTGLVGQAVCQSLAAHQHEVMATGSEVNITSPEAVLNYAQQVRPTHIVNCAAMTQVDACETQDHQAMGVNGQGPAHVARAAKAVGAAVLHISSDYVFDGEHPEPRQEHDAVGPKSAFGRSKLAGEEGFLGELKDSDLPHYIVRTSWVFGPGGGNFVATMLRLMAERPIVQGVADQHGRPTYTPDLARPVLALMGLDGEATGPCPSGIYHFANSGSTSWHGLCTEVLAQAQSMGHPLRCQKVEAVTTDAFSRPAPRPAFSVLGTTKFEQATQWVPQAFEQALSQYMGTLTSP